jgi:hypothetical protein
MRQLTRLQLAALWICVLYLGVAFSLVAARAMWGFLRLASEVREAQVPREVLLSVAESASRDFWWHALLAAVGFVMLGAVVIWITKSRRV